MMRWRWMLLLVVGGVMRERGESGHHGDWCELWTCGTMMMTMTMLPFVVGSTAGAVGIVLQ